MYDLHNEKQTQNMWKNLPVIVIQLASKNSTKGFHWLVLFLNPMPKLYKEGVF